MDLRPSRRSFDVYAYGSDFGIFFFVLQHQKHMILGVNMRCIICNYDHNPLAQMCNISKQGRLILCINISKDNDLEVQISLSKIELRIYKYYYIKVIVSVGYMPRLCMFPHMHVVLDVYCRNFDRRSM